MQSIFSVNIIIVPSILQGSRRPGELHHSILLNLIFFVGGWWVQVKLLFDGERKLCDQIWYHLHPHREKCFADVTDSCLQVERFVVHLRGQQHLLLPLFVLLG